MPCSSDGFEPTGPSREDSLRTELDLTTRLLCHLIRQLPRNSPTLDPETVAWFKTHDAADKRRATQEEFERAKKEARYKQELEALQRKFGKIE